LISFSIQIALVCKKKKESGQREREREKKSNFLCNFHQSPANLIPLSIEIALFSREKESGEGKKPDFSVLISFSP